MNKELDKNIELKGICFDTFGDRLHPPDPNCSFCFPKKFPGNPLPQSKTEQEKEEIKMAKATRKFFKTIIQVEVLSEDAPIDTGRDSLADIDYAITNGDCSGSYEVKSVKELTPKQMAKALLAQASSPEFFRLDEKGNEIEI